MSGEAAIEILTRGKKNLSRQDLYRGLAAHNRSFVRKKKPLAPRVFVTGRNKGNNSVRTDRLFANEIQSAC